MRINDRNGTVEIKLTKAETERFLEASYLAERIAKNTEGGTAEVAKRAADGNRLIAGSYGAQYLDENGNLIGKQRDESEAPREAEAPAASDASLDYAGPMKSVGA